MARLFRFWLPLRVVWCVTTLSNGKTAATMTINQKKTPEIAAPGFSLCVNMARLFRLSDDIIAYAVLDFNIRLGGYF